MAVSPSLKNRLYRVVVKWHRDSNALTAIVGDGMRKFYSDIEDAPEAIRASIAFGSGFVKDRGDPVKNHLFGEDAFTCPYPELKDIGWPLGEDYYCVIIKEDLLREMRGEANADT